MMCPCESKKTVTCGNGMKKFFFACYEARYPIGRPDFLSNHKLSDIGWFLKYNFQVIYFSFGYNFTNIYLSPQTSWFLLQIYSFNSTYPASIYLRYCSMPILSVLFTSQNNSISNLTPVTVTTGPILDPYFGYTSSQSKY